MRVLVLATTTGYQTRAFGDAAERLGVELVFATDRCHLIEDPWQDGAVPIRFYDEDASVAAIVDTARARPIEGLVVVGDRPTVIAARAAEALGIPWHPPAAAATARNKRFTRERLRDAGLPVPWFVDVPIDSRLVTADFGPQNSQSRIPIPDSLSYPCVLKPAALSGSRGVMRANDRRELAAAFDRLRALLRAPDVRAERNDAHDVAIVEGFIPGREYAVEGLMHGGELEVLAIFDKPDPLDGPFFEETIYVTPPAASPREQRAIVDAIDRAGRAIGLRHGPIHAECRVNDAGVFVLEVAARPIGGLCARALRFDGEERQGTGFKTQDTGSTTQAARSETNDVAAVSDPAASQPPKAGSQQQIAGRKPAASSHLSPTPAALEELLLRHALGEDVRSWRRERAASGVMMIPIPRRGTYRGVDGVDAARAVPHVDDVRITAKADQLLVPLPEGASYLGFIFARADAPALVERALREAHARLRFAVDPEFPILAAEQINYNR